MVLIVDDKPENLLSLKKVLQLHNIEADTAASGEEALQKILKQSYSLIILDVQMPGMDGFEVAEAVGGYSKTRDIPIIFLSAVNTDKKFITQGYESGGIDYVTKPADPDILLLKVKTMIRLYEQTRELKNMQLALQEEIRERQKAELSLQETVSQLHSFIESIPQVAFTASVTGTIEEVNERWYRFSPSMDQFPQNHPQEQPIGEALQQSVRSGNPLEMELRLRELGKKDYRYYLLRVHPVPGTDGKIIRWVGTFTDIHVQKEINEILERKVEERTLALTRSNAELEEKNHELQQFTSVASHDLKEPLRKIQVFSSIVLSKLEDTGQSDAGSYVRRIISASERMSGLIQDLLAYSRLSMDSLFQPADLNRLISEILEDLEIQITERNALITVEPLPMVEVIPGQIRQLFQNIISNALKFSRTDVRPEIGISYELLEDLSMDSPQSEDGAYCRIEIRDNGIGFNEAYLEKIFTLFQRLNPREKFEGTGIGLAIARKIVDKHGGLITARSKENEGSSFYIILPLTHSTEKIPAKTTQL